MNYPSLQIGFANEIDYSEFETFVNDSLDSIGVDEDEFSDEKMKALSKRLFLRLLEEKQYYVPDQKQNPHD